MECKQAAIEQSLKLAGCYALTTDVTPEKLDAEQVHTSYMALEKVERDFRAIKTGLLEVRPIFVRKEGRTRGHVFCCMLALKLAREMERRLRAAFGATETKFIVEIAIEVLSPKGFGRVRMQRVDDVSGASLVPFVCAAVESGWACRIGHTRILLRACSGCCWLCARIGCRGSWVGFLLFHSWESFCFCCC